MDNTKTFVACFIGVILVISSIPLYVYLNDNSETSTPIDVKPVRILCGTQNFS